MKKRLCLVVLLALVGAALWRFARPAAKALPAVKVAETPTALKSVVSVLTLKPAQVEPPKVAPAAPKPGPVEAAAIDSREDPQAAVKDMVRLLDAGDLTDAIKTYSTPVAVAQISHQQGLDQFIEMVKNTPDFEQNLADLREALASIKDTTPVYSQGANHQEFADFKLNPPIGGKDHLAFKKVDGLWYSLDIPPSSTPADHQVDDALARARQRPGTSSPPP